MLTPLNSKSEAPIFMTYSFAITREEFDQLAEEIDLQEPIEELLAQLTK
jgi:hypothetical protein